MKKIRRRCTARAKLRNDSNFDCNFCSFYCRCRIKYRKCGVLAVCVCRAHIATENNAIKNNGINFVWILESQTTVFPPRQRSEQTFDFRFTYSRTRGLKGKIRNGPAQCSWQRRQRASDCDDSHCVFWDLGGSEKLISDGITYERFVILIHSINYSAFGMQIRFFFFFRFIVVVPLFVYHCCSTMCHLLIPLCSRRC